jgi:cytochrome b561
MPPVLTYSWAQRILHWLMAAIILCMIPAGLTMANLLADGPAKNTVYELHKSFGLVLFALILVRIAVRWSRGAPPLVPGLPRWQRIAARISHYALYGLMVLVPIAGWSGTSACCAPVNLFWTVPLTLPVEGGMETGKAIFKVHATLALLLAAIVLVHVSAALHHHLVRRDATLRRMWQGAP